MRNELYIMQNTRNTLRVSTLHTKIMQIMTQKRSEKIEVYVSKRVKNKAILKASEKNLSLSSFINYLISKI